jgi:hypothetical protein
MLIYSPAWTWFWSMTAPPGHLSCSRKAVMYSLKSSLLVHRDCSWCDINCVITGIQRAYINADLFSCMDLVLVNGCHSRASFFLQKVCHVNRKSSVLVQGDCFRCDMNSLSTAIQSAYNNADLFPCMDLVLVNG